MLESLTRLIPWLMAGLIAGRVVVLFMAFLEMRREERRLKELFRAREREQTRLGSR